jgi:hypothetical protein
MKYIPSGEYHAGVPVVAPRYFGAAMRLTSPSSIPPRGIRETNVEGVDRLWQRKAGAISIQ